MNLADVIGDFLADLVESDLYLPFFGLLLAEGFTDVHFTHGGAEFGKDFIAKRASEAGAMEQWCFQLKAGNINQGTWRTDVQGQLLEATTSGLGHPSFDATMPRRVVLVTSGRLVGQAPIAFQNFNTDQLPRLGANPIAVWDIEHLKARFAEKASASLLPKAEHLKSLGAMLQAYGNALQGGATASDIEVYGRGWVASPKSQTEDAAFRAAIQAALLADAFRRQTRGYEETHCYLALMRAALSHAAQNPKNPQLRTILAFARNDAVRASLDFTTRAARCWREQGHHALRAFGVAMAGPAHYLALCARVAECASIVATLSTSQADREFAVAFLREWVEREPGVTRPLSDKYAVSLVWTLLVLWTNGARTEAQKALRNAAIWVCDRYEGDSCLAGVHSSALDEVHALLGEAFDFIDVERRRQSTLACALADFAAFTGDQSLYGDIINDFKAVGVCPEYVQADDNPDQFRLDGDAVRQYANIEFDDSLGEAPWKYADHVRHEPPTFAMADAIGAEHYVAISLVLRDRYFPLLWSRIAALASS